MLNVMTVQCDTPTVAIMNIMDNDPNPHASITPISQESIEKHILCGRRFDVSMLMYSVNSCSCCGRTEPVHLDPEFPSDAPFERTSETGFLLLIHFLLNKIHYFLHPSIF